MNTAAQNLLETASQQARGMNFPMSARILGDAAKRSDVSMTQAVEMLDLRKYAVPDRAFADFLHGILGEVAKQQNNVKGELTRILGEGGRIAGLEAEIRSLRERLVAMTGQAAQAQALREERDALNGRLAQASSDLAAAGEEMSLHLQSVHKGGAEIARLKNELEYETERARKNKAAAEDAQRASGQHRREKEAAEAEVRELKKAIANLAEVRSFLELLKSNTKEKTFPDAMLAIKGMMEESRKENARLEALRKDLSQKGSDLGRQRHEVQRKANAADALVAERDRLAERVRQLTEENGLLKSPAARPAVPARPAAQENVEEGGEEVDALADSAYEKQPSDPGLPPRAGELARMEAAADRLLAISQQMAELGDGVSWKYGAAASRLGSRADKLRVVRQDASGQDYGGNALETLADWADEGVCAEIAKAATAVLSHVADRISGRHHSSTRTTNGTASGHMGNFLSGIFNRAKPDSSAPRESLLAMAKLDLSAFCAASVDDDSGLGVSTALGGCSGGEILAALDCAARAMRASGPTSDIGGALLEILESSEYANLAQELKDACVRGLKGLA